MHASALIAIFVLLALPAVLCHGGSFREVDEQRDNRRAEARRINVNRPGFQSRVRRR